ncbi:MAG: glycosyltransferase [Dysgonamonadaceae bacterium]|jgi:glycosyltransferase|nr:glycosyltransferase [Dysgonamonadaceae bacterium]
MKYSASNYGVGTYFRSIIDSLKESSQIKLNIIELGMTSTQEVIIEEKEGIKFIKIPGSTKRLNDKKYSRNVLYILKSYILEKECHKILFHLNFMNNAYLAECIRQLYPSSKIILTVHYTEWIFQFLGDMNRIKNVIKRKNSETLSIEEKKALKDFEFEKKLINNCDRIIAIASHSSRKLQSLYGVKQSKITLISNGLQDRYIQFSDKAKREIKKQYKIASKEKIILYVGRLSEEKGGHILVKAFNNLLDRYDNLRLFIAGNGDFNAFFSQMKSINSRITLTGFLAKEDVFKLYSIADIGIVPSFHEEFGYVAVEMMMHQLPIIVNNTSGLSEIVTNGFNGLYVNFNTKTEETSTILQLAQAIEQLLADQKLKEYLAINARKTFLEKYDLKLFSKRMANFYLNTI